MFPPDDLFRHTGISFLCAFFSFQSVLDPVTGKEVSVAEAIEKGIIDPRTGRYINPLTGDSIDINDAIERGFIKCFKIERIPRRKIIIEEEPKEKVLERDFVISGVTDPRTGKVLSLQEAIDKGLVDPEKGTYTDPITGEVKPLYEAMKQGIVYARIADPDNDKDNPNALRTRIIQVLTNGVADEDDIGTDLVDYDPRLWNTNHAVYSSVIKENVDSNLGGIREQTTGRVSCQANANPENGKTSFILQENIKV